MHYLTIISKLREFILPHSQLLVGFSGGLDSTVLLHSLMLLRNQHYDIRLRAIHIHHGLSQHADEWVTHCQSICAAWDIPLIIEYVILKDNKLGIEGQARKARYTAFANALLPGEALATAQHLDDQCETILLALKRGSGPTGLSGMSNRSVFAGTQHLRPLLSISRVLLKEWAKEYSLCWIEDKSNQNISYDRNFLRLQVIPILISRWPHFINTTVRSAQLCAEQENLLDELLADELVEAMPEKGAILIAALHNKSVVHRAALLRRWLAMYQVAMPSRSMLIRIWHEVALARKDASPVLHLSGFNIRRYHGRLWLVPYLPKMTNHVLAWHNLLEPLTLSYSMGEVLFQPGGNVRLPKVGEQVTVRFQARGVIHIAGRRGGKKIKKIWQEYKIPPWRREITPLLFYNEVLIAAAGVFVTQDGFLKEGMQFFWKINKDSHY